MASISNIKLGFILHFFFVFMVASISTSRQFNFNGRQYLTIKKQGSYQTDSNHIELEFKTIHPSGILVMMTRKNKDSLIIQLVKGSLRYTIFRQNEEIVEFSVGKNLADNDWHKLSILRTERVNVITLDGEKKTSLSPSSHGNASRYDHYTIGGVERTTLSTSLKKLISKPMFTGCMVILSKKMKMAGGSPISSSCKTLTPFLMTMKKGISHVNFDINETSKRQDKQNILKVNVQIRTLYATGRIMYIVRGAYTIDAGINDGKIYLNVRYKNITIFNKQSDEVNDGAWHEIYVTINVKFIEFKISAKTIGKKLRQSSVENLPNQINVNIGSKNSRDGMVGCIHGLSINDQKINASSIKLDSNSNIELNKCKIIDRCTPNPCQYNGRCTQNVEKYECDCSQTRYYGEKCENYKFKSSCAEYKHLGLKNESHCLIDPDGIGTIEPYTTICKITEKGEAITVINHKQRVEFNALKNGIKFLKYRFHRLDYEMDDQRIKSLVDSSARCRQKVVFKCLNANFFDNRKNQANIVWKARNGEVKQYWGGAVNGNKGCACGLNKTCSDPTKLCNCDANSPNWQEDSGYLTQKEFLPIRRLQVNEQEMKAGKFYIGPLECYGEANKEQYSIPDNAKDILKEACISVKTKTSLIQKANNLLSKTLKFETTFNTSDEDKNEKDELKKKLISKKGASTKNKTTREIDIKIKSNSTSFDEEDDEVEDEPNAIVKAFKLYSKLSAATKIKEGKIIGEIEIVVIAFAGLAVVVLLVKYIMFDRLCKRNDRGELILNQRDEYDYARDSHISGTGSSVGGTIPRDHCACNGKMTRNPINAYWV